MAAPKKNPNYRQRILLAIICFLGAVIVIGSIMNMTSDWYIPGLMPFAQCGIMISLLALIKEKRVTIPYYKVTVVMFWIAVALNFVAGIMQLVNTGK